MCDIPRANVSGIRSKVTPNNLDPQTKEKKILFSFEAVDKNEYFNLDGTCQSWAADLFDTMKIVSGLKLKEIYTKEYSGKKSPLRIHPHKNATVPCKLPKNVALNDMWQIRISVSKGGIHGIFSGNVFYVIWFDPQHNLYPDKNHGGLTKIIPPSTCCKDRDKQISEMQEELNNLKEELQNCKNECRFWENYAQELEKRSYET